MQRQTTAENRKKTEKVPDIGKCPGLLSLWRQARTGIPETEAGQKMAGISLEIRRPAAKEAAFAANA